MELDRDSLLVAAGLGQEVDANDIRTTTNEEDFIDDGDDIEDDESEFESSSSSREEMEFDF